MSLNYSLKYHSYRVRGVYRIIYKIFHEDHLLYIEDIAHRREAYR